MGVYANINGSLVTISGMPPDMTGATASTPGEHGLAPAPLVANRNDFLRGDGTWGDNNFIGTIDEWNALSVVDKLKYKTADITDGIVPPTTYTITYNANGGSGSMTVDTKIEDESYIIEDNGFTPPSGKIFVEWNTSADGSGTTYHADDTYTTNADLMLYAIWDWAALKFSSDEPFTLSVAMPGWLAASNPGYIQYSVDNGTSWSTWDGSELSGTASQPIYLRGKNNTVITGEDPNGHKWTFTGKYITGNIETLLNYETVINGGHPIMNTCCYGAMFYECTSLVTAPQLPATTLADKCYSYMFRDCTSLITTPQLPATTLVDSCYWNMFYSCTSLKLSTSKTGIYQYEYRIPTSSTGITATDALTDMFANTGGTFTGTPSLNTIYYTDHAPV